MVCHRRLPNSSQSRHLGNIPDMVCTSAGYLFTYYNSKLSKEREAQIDRVNAQVKAEAGLYNVRLQAPCAGVADVHECRGFQAVGAACAGAGRQFCSCVPQVKSLYGPLLACLTTSRSAFDAMLKQHSPDGTRQALVAAIHENPGGHEGEAYRCSPPF